MITEYDIVKTLIRTEKASLVEPQGQYVFEVARRANKIEIKKAVEAIYKVSVAHVRTSVVPGKKKRVRQEFGHTTPWKKAVVSLREGQKIEIK